MATNINKIITKEVEMAIRERDVRTKIRITWDKLHSSLKGFRIQPDLDPRGYAAIFKFYTNTATGWVKVDINPFYISVPESTIIEGGKADVKIFAFYKGWLEFVGIDKEKRLILGDFGTSVEYYRKRDRIVRSLCSFHFDNELTFDPKGLLLKEKLDHPAFHAQLSNDSDMFRNSELNKGNLKFRELQSVESNIRVPTVQLDIFSAILGYCADVLYSESKSNVFEEIQKTFNFFNGIDVPHKSGRLYPNQRGVHLY